MLRCTSAVVALLAAACSTPAVPSSADRNAELLAAAAAGLPYDHNGAPEKYGSHSEGEVAAKVADWDRARQIAGQVKCDLCVLLAEDLLLEAVRVTPSSPAAALHRVRYDEGRVSRLPREGQIRVRTGSPRESKAPELGKGCRARAARGQNDPCLWSPAAQGYVCPIAASGGGNK